jgi:ankyrin repeat protein
MQDGFTPALIASQKGYAETLALLLANKADINVAIKVHQLIYPNIYNWLTTSFNI